MPYPSTLSNFPANINGSESLKEANHHELHNRVERAINDIELELGIAPSGVFDSVRARFDNSILSLKDFGAKGDGSTDDTVAIQNAINSGSPIVVTPGTYITQQISLPVGGNIRWHGFGQGVTNIKLKNGTNTSIFTMGSGRADVTFADITFDGNSANQTSGTSNGVNADTGVTRLTIRNCRFLNFRTRGISLAGTVVDARIESCTFDGASSHLALAQQQTVFQSCTFRNGPTTSLLIGDDCKVVNCRFEAASATQRFAIATGVSTSVGNRSVIAHNTFSWAAAGASSDTDTVISTHSDASLLRVVNNILVCGPHVGGIFIGGLGTPAAVTASRCLISGNTIESPIGDGILVAQTGAGHTGVNNVICNNTVRDASKGTGGAVGIGIEVHMSRSVVTGNTVEDSDGAGIWVGGLDSNVFGNTTRGNNLTADGGGIKLTRSGIVATNNVSLDNGDPANVFGGFGIQVINDTAYGNISGVTLRNNRCSDTRSGGSRTQDYGVYVSDFGAFTVANVTVINNDLTNNVTGPYSIVNTGGGNTVRDNQGVSPRVATATNYTITGYEVVVGVTSTAAARTITLPAATAVLAGQVFTVKDESGAAATNNITVARAGTDTIDGATSKVVNTNYGFVRFYSDGVSKWFVV